MSMGTVAVIEDNEQSRRLLTDILDFHGYCVIGYERAEEALDASIAADLVLMDIRLPGIDGFDALSRLRALPGGDRVKVIAVTASAMDYDRKRIREAGFDAYLPKPVNRHELLETIRRLLPDRSLPQMLDG
jgi:CheY-like chemotaxis protein